MTLAILRKLDTLFSLAPGEYGPYGGIGSRETPPNICRDMNLIGAALYRRGFILRSGGAPGADVACEAEVPPHAKEVYLPWRGFNGSSSPLYPTGLTDAAIATEAQRQAPSFDPATLLDFEGEAASPLELAGRATLIAQHFHPAWDRCTPAAKKLHTRNVPQILGRTLNKPSRFTVCYTKDGRASGGTGQALRICIELGIPILNLHNTLVRNQVVSLLR